jgi:galactose mutarotase-like enzyme
VVGQDLGNADRRVCGGGEGVVKMAENCPALVEKENVLIRAGECAITLYPHLGGKIASIRAKNRELLQAPLAPLAQRTRTMPFDAGDASGWDECLPSVGACTVQTESRAAEIPDHGDLWRVEWTNRDQGWRGREEADAPVTLTGQCFSLPLSLERTISLSELPGRWHIRLDYKLTNTGSQPVPWSWAAHPLFAAEPGDRILLPDSIRSLRLEGSGGRRLGTGGDIIAWPIATLADGSEADLSIAEPPEASIGDKLFAGPLNASESWCALERPSAGIRIRVRFDSSATPYLGLWICYGGWPDRPGPKQICVALEPSTAPVDSLAQTGTWSRILNSGESYSWPMFIDLEPI